MFKLIKKRRVTDEIVDQIRTAILEGKIRPGGKLPPERELLEQFGISRVSLREALNSLESTGFIETRRGEGSFVKSILNVTIKDPISLVIKENAEKLFDLIEVRKEIEAWSAYHAATRATEKEIESLGTIMEEMEKELNEKKTFKKLDLNFHLAISQASHNIIQSHLMFTIQDLLSEHLDLLLDQTSQREELPQKIFSQHLAIYRGIKDRSPEKARESMIIHLDFVEKELRNIVGIHQGSE